MNQTFNRRRFLRTIALGAAASPILLSPWVRAQTVQTLLGSPMQDPDSLIALANKALEAARAAGASYADVRILHGVRFSWGSNLLIASKEGDSKSGVGQPKLGRLARIGIRAWFGGRMGFAGNILPKNDDETVALAQLAVNRAKAWPGADSQTFDLVPVPVVKNGNWQTPIQKDPFAVPIGEQEQLLLDVIAAVKDIKLSSGRIGAGIDVAWTRTNDLFVSSEGSLIQQQVHTAADGSYLWSEPWDDNYEDFSLPLLGASGAYGYEVLDNVKDRIIKRFAEVEELRKIPVRGVDIGRYDVVLSARAAAQLVAATIAPPLELDRVLQRASINKNHNISYASPPNEVLGKFKLGSELLNIVADRTRPGLSGTTGWDSEGVKTREFELVKDGIIVDYLSDRSSAAALKSAYERMGKPLQSNACSGDSGGRLPVIKSPNLALLPGKEELSADDLIKDIKRGYYIDDLYVSSDHAGLNTQANARHVRQIVDGKKGDFVFKSAMQFNTPQFWQNLVALGGAASVRP